MADLKINPRRVKKKLTDFIRNNVYNKGFERAVLGLSGGLDSTTAAYLVCEALGPDNILGLIMPYRTTSRTDIVDAKDISRKLGIKIKYINITDMVEPYFKKVNLKDKIRCGNKMARERMSILYDQSKGFNGLVIGTSNRTETLLGYGTIYGDIACAINPLGGLYKTEVIQLAKFLKVPNPIINKIPSAGLWKGQTDEGELGLKYKDVDRLLYYFIDKKYTIGQLIRRGFSKDFIYKTIDKIKKNRFKCQLPKIARPK